MPQAISANPNVWEGVSRNWLDPIAAHDLRGLLRRATEQGRTVITEIMFATAANNVNTFKNGRHKGGMVGNIFSGNVKGGSVVGRSANKLQTRCIIDAFATGNGFKRDQTLVVVHGQYRIKLLVTAAGKKSIGTVRAKGQNTFVFSFFNCGFYYLFFS